MQPTPAPAGFEATEQLEFRGTDEPFGTEPLYPALAAWKSTRTLKIVNDRLGLRPSNYGPPRISDFRRLKQVKKRAWVGRSDELDRVETRAPYLQVQANGLPLQLRKINSLPLHLVFAALQNLGRILEGKSFNPFPALPGQVQWV